MGFKLGRWFPCDLGGHLALNAFAKLTVDGALVDGVLGQDRTVDTMGGLDVRDRIEVLYFRGGTEIAAQGAQGARAIGHRRHGELSLVARLGSAAPRLAQALAQNASVDLDIAMFGLNHHSGDVEHHFTLRASHGRLVRLEIQQPHTRGAHPGLPAMIRFGVVPGSVSWISETMSLSFEDAGRTRLR